MVSLLLFPLPLRSNAGALLWSPEPKPRPRASAGAMNASLCSLLCSKYRRGHRPKPLRPPRAPLRHRRAEPSAARNSRAKPSAVHSFAARPPLRRPTAFNSKSSPLLHAFKRDRFPLLSAEVRHKTPLLSLIHCSGIEIDRSSCFRACWCPSPTHPSCGGAAR
jgi:hypothetical protein